MILLHISTKDEQQAEEIVEFLIREKLVVDAFISDGEKQKLGNDGKIMKELQFLITAKAKALLFDKIDKEIRKKYASDVPEIYSLPIVNMDWGQSAPD
ncbi:MAG: divalent cation tolerance protein CutA [Cyclobacteriaceae bacterium]